MMTPEQTAALQEASRKARRKPIEGHPDNTIGEVVRFASAGDAAEWLLSTGVGKSLRGVRHLIYESLAGRRASAYGYKWRHSSSEG